MLVKFTFSASKTKSRKVSASGVAETLTCSLILTYTTSWWITTFKVELVRLETSFVWMF